MTRKKLIEVALSLEAINAASAREKSIRHGHPSTLHLWWARRPLAACRAVLFVQLVDDPSSVPEEFPDEAAQEKERQRLFRIVEELVKWESSNDRRVIAAARREISRSAARAQGEAPPRTKAEVDAFLAEKAPPVLDPFCGGGSIPLEAQRLGLRAHGSDLNPVAVLISKALVEIPPRFADLPPANPEAQACFARGAVWNGKGAAGLAEDVRHYGSWMRAEAAHLTFAMGPARAENARALAYRLYTVSERKGWTQEALACNILATSWAADPGPSRRAGRRRRWGYEIDTPSTLRARGSPVGFGWAPSRVSCIDSMKASYVRWRPTWEPCARPSR